MPQFRILDAKNNEDLEYWIKLWNQWPANELNAHPYYCRIFANDFERVLCAVKETIHTVVMFPLILRPLSKVPWLGNKFNEYYDLITPHGYSGPFLWGEPSVGDFWDEFDNWAKSNLIVSIYARLSLFSHELLPLNNYLETRCISSNIIRRLHLSSDEIWSDYEHKVRKNVKKAIRNGVEIEVDWSGKRLEEFIKIYNLTMERRNASEYYLFGEPFFRQLLECFKGNIVFFHALYKGQVISTEMNLISSKHIYSFLGGTLPEYFELRPNDLIKHTIIEFGREQGKDDYILGGGYYDGAIEDDGIFKYKKSFSPNGIVPYMVGSRVINSEVYDDLVNSRIDIEATQGNQWIPNPDFFPCYRS